MDGPDGPDGAGYDGHDGNGFDAMPGLFAANASHAGDGTDADARAKAGSCRIGFETGYLTHALTRMGWCLGDTETCDRAEQAEGVRRVRLPGVAGTGRTFQSLIYPHGEVNAANLFKGIAAAHGLVNIAWTARDINPENKLHHMLKDTTPFDGKERNTPMPSGWYPGATGLTRTFQQYWQIPKKPFFWSTPAADPLDKTYLIVSGATWYYNETCDHETRLAITVHSLPYTECGYWKERTKLIESHLAVAKACADEFFARMKAYTPDEHSLLVRRLQASGELRRLREPSIDTLPLNPDVQRGADPIVGTGPGPLRRRGHHTGGDPVTDFDMSAVGR